MLLDRAAEAREQHDRCIARALDAERAGDGAAVLRETMAALDHLLAAVCDEEAAAIMQRTVETGARILAEGARHEEVQP
jgi:hypothetical protein